MQVVLHLTDTHFGWEGEKKSDLAERKLCLDGLLSAIKSGGDDWRPSVICITGDLAWGGTVSDYSKAKEWLDQLLTACHLTYNEVIISPGNHDVIRAVAEKIPRPGETHEADIVLKPPIADHFEGPFNGYINFCEGAKIPKLKFGDSESYLVGQRIVNNIRFIVLNSSWFSKDNNDKGKLWIGLPHLKYMEACGDLEEIDPERDNLTTIALLHHPGEMLHYDEKHATNSRPNCQDYLAHRSHIILTGHTHGEVRKPDRIAEGALHFTGGSAYAGASYFNSFRLFQLPGNKNIVYRSFEFNPNATRSNWKSTEATSRHLSVTIALDKQDGQQGDSDSVEITQYQSEFLKNATQHLVRKSRLIKQSGNLPKISERPVALRASAEKNQYDHLGRIIRPKNSDFQIPLYKAVRESRRTLLLGDLGSGKSTLAAQLVKRTNEQLVNGVALFITSKSLQVDINFCTKTLIDEINNYVTREILVKQPNFKIELLLEKQVEVLIVLDGIDELSRSNAGRLLNHASLLTEHWANIQVVATARPVELIGISYQDWKLTSTVNLDDSAKTDLIMQELDAEGVPSNQQRERADKIVRRIKQQPSLEAICRTPLALRLTHGRIKDLEPKDNISLGELLYDLLIERLDGWQKRDDKPKTYESFQRAYPTAKQKAILLSHLARSAVNGEKLNLDSASIVLGKAIGDDSEFDKDLLVEEGLHFYQWLGFITIDDTVGFPLYSLAEVSFAFGELTRLVTNENQEFIIKTEQWRVVSFIASIAQRSGLYGDVERFLIDYIDKLLKVPGNVPAACYIVTEANSLALANQTILGFENIGFRPLTGFFEERHTSANNIAYTLYLAGGNGFDWFYDQYLAPHLPLPNAGSAIVISVFNAWAALIRNELTKDQKEKLSTLVLPLLATGESHFFGGLNVLSVLVPDAFELEDRLWYQSLALADERFTGSVESHFLELIEEGTLNDLINSILIHRSQASSKAAGMWLRINEREVPPLQIIRQSFVLAANIVQTSEEMFVLESCKERLGNKWLYFARMELILGGPSVANGAAKVLFDAGERRLAVLGPTFMRSMHDGGYSETAERLLSEMVLGGSEDYFLWFANRVFQSDDMNGGHSGWWRILLKRIEDVDNGPNILSSCLKSIGPFTLPRYPEVREAFSRLLNGKRGTAFRDALKKNLKNLDPEVRRGNALVLVTVDPGHESEALFVSIRGHSKNLQFDWHEWDKFCLSLQFGPTVLAYLKSKLSELSLQTRLFALVLLNKSGETLSTKYRQELITNLPYTDIYSLMNEESSKELFRSSDTYEYLKYKLVSSPDNQTAKIFRELYQVELSKSEEARCLILENDRYSLYWNATEKFNRVVIESDLAEELIKLSQDDSLAKYWLHPLILVAQAVNIPDKWKDVVWTLLCEDTWHGGSRESDGAGMVLLEFGLKNTQYRNAIGEAAKVCLNDPRTQQNRWHDSYHWLALLAAEFCGLDAIQLTKAILHGSPIQYSATKALIGRLGSVPDDFRWKKGVRKKPDDILLQLGNKKMEDTEKTLLDYSRESEEIHPDLISTIYQTLYGEELSDSTISSIAQAGRPGILTSVVYRFVYNKKQRADETIPLLGVWNKIYPNRRQTNSSWSELAGAWRRIRSSVLLDEGDLKAEYLLALEKALLENEGKNLELVWEVFQANKFIKKDYIPRFFTEYSRYNTYLHEALFVEICRWLSGDIEDETLRVVIIAARDAVEKLNEDDFSRAHRDNPNTWAYLLFPVILWANDVVQSSSDEAVFLRGIRSLFDSIPNSRSNERHDPSRLFLCLEPLIQKVAPENWRHVLEKGIDSGEPSISVFCRLMWALN